jgi:hypothetical protein
VYECVQAGSFGHRRLRNYLCRDPFFDKSNRVAMKPSRELMIVATVAALALLLATAVRHFRSAPPIELQPWGIPK